MSVMEIVAGSVLIFVSLILVLIVLSMESKDQGLTSAIGGGYNESFYGKNGGNTKDAKLGRIARVCSVLLFIVTLAVNIVVSIYFNK
ncbi:MAG: preprotein translocase subunit SecG [Ruminococcus sp.]|jgi:preprotein translocase subunit SecG|nr:preprotein translocase subunit SecG [Ruminococcus sp.]MBQ1903234.1 preprotein translocase subunit SecG [Ruminococcus sp.]